jgi:hypothetical protein
MVAAMKTSMFFAVLGLFVSQLSYAGPAQHEVLKELDFENPEVLSYSAFVDPDCPLTVEKVDDIFEGVLVGSRIKPLNMRDYFSPDGIHLEIRLYCVTEETIEPAYSVKPVYSIEISFVRYMPSPKVSFRPMYPSLGIGDAEFIASTLKAMFTEVTADYSKANFDL